MKCTEVLFHVLRRIHDYIRDIDVGSDQFCSCIVQTWSHLDRYSGCLGFNVIMMYPSFINKCSFDKQC